MIAAGMPQAGPPRSVPLPRSHEMRFDNGLRVIAASRELGASLHIPLVAAVLVVEPGSASDPPRLPGVASLALGLLRQGTAKHTALELDMAIDALGARLDRSAGYDANTVGAGATTAVFTQACALLAETVREPAFAADEFERARTRTLSDLRLAYSSPSSLARLVAARLVAGDSPYGHPIAGTPRSLEALRRDEIVAFWRHTFRPEHATLLLGGDVTVDDAFALARTIFGDWQVDPHPAAMVVAIPQPPPRRRVVAIDKPDAGRTAVIVTRAAPPRNDDAYYAGIVATGILSGYSGRLNQEIRVKRGLSYGAGASLIARRDSGQFVASTLVDHKRALETVDVILETFGSLVAVPPAERELSARKASLLGSWSRSIETNDGLLSALGDFALYGIPLDELERYAERITSIDVDAIAAFAQRYIVPEPTIVLVGDTRVYAAELGKVADDVRVIPAAELDLETLT